MKCQKCGAHIGEGKLYCETCGNEIQMVPDFDPEVEQTINQAMDHIVNDVFERDVNVNGYQKNQVHEEDEESQEKDAFEPNRKAWLEHFSLTEKRYYRWIILILGISFFVLLLVLGYMNFTADYQLRRGNYFLEMQDYESAMKHYEKAGTLAPENAEISLYLAACYEVLDRMPGYEACLTKVIQNQDATYMQLELAYTRLATLYLEKKEYQKIDSLLKECEIENVIKIFGIYCAQPPMFSHEGGEYTAIVPLKIEGGEKGTVYYTIDGADPTVESLKYNGPVFLNKGEHTIKAIYVNEFGVVSQAVTGKFVIQF